MERERKNKTVMENSPLEYRWLSVHIILFCTVLLGMYLRRNITATSRKELSSSTEYFNGLMKKGKSKELKMCTCNESVVYI
jgi:hypothetical protein